MKDKIKELCLQNLENEVCGLILDNKTVYPCRNTSSKSRFSISEIDYLKASAKGEITGCYHSHLNSEKPSFLDKINCKHHDIQFLIYCIKQDKFIELNPNDIKDTYFGRDFVFGKTDCFTLIRDFYLNELNIEIPDYFRDVNYWKSGLIESKIKEFGKFKLIHEGKMSDTGFLKENDIIIFGGIAKHMKHLGVYVGNEVVLHHPTGRKSEFAQIDKKIKRITKGVLRHESFT